MCDSPQLLFQHHLKALRLPAFKSEYDKLARQCALARVGYVVRTRARVPPTSRA